MRDDKPATPPRLRGDSKPHLTGAAERMTADRRERRHATAARREALVETGCALAFLAIAAGLPRMFGADTPPVGVAGALIIAFALVSRVEFDVGAGYTIPTQMLFVPVLFLADPAWAPLVVAAGLVLGRARDIVRDHNPGRQVLVSVNNAWFAVGPALVLAAFHVSVPMWGEWPIYLFALASQFLGDRLVGAVRDGSRSASSRACSCA